MNTALAIILLFVAFFFFRSIGRKKPQPVDKPQGTSPTFMHDVAEIMEHIEDVSGLPRDQQLAKIAFCEALIQSLGQRYHYINGVMDDVEELYKQLSVQRNKFLSRGLRSMPG